MQTGVAAFLAVLAAGVLASCGSSDTLTIYGASSLKQVLPAIEASPTYSFAGSDVLAQQIENGAPADLFAAASPKAPEQLAAEGLCEEPVAFASNTLAIIVPSGSKQIASLADLESGPRRRLAIGVAAVPIGSYTREVLANAGAEAVLTRNTVSDEQDAAGIVSKVALGSADAGIAYVTDAKSSDGRVRAVALPASAQPVVTYMACVVVRDGANTTVAKDYLTNLTGPDGQAALKAAGFGPAPSK
jgi:molybdate transport system substrate-binding protein